MSVFPPEIIAAAAASRRLWNIPASVTLAQWALESAWGKAMPTGSNNPFGIKAVAGQPTVSAMTTEVSHGRTVHIAQPFAKFASISDAFAAHAKLLATSHFYAAARSKLPSADGFAAALTGVYATDPHYGATLIGLMRSNNLYRYDHDGATSALAQ